ncbi:MAG: PAS domain S-box protein [Desulfobacteraceae bacterium]|nr:PAS domain S-box protein [Desulfobacteraceae bacterium]
MDDIMSETKLTPLQALGEISKILRYDQNGGENFGKALSLLCTSMTARTAALIIKRFIGEEDKEKFLLECLSCWNALEENATHKTCQFKSLRPEDLPQEWWKHLKDHELVFVNELSSPIPGCSSNTFLVPLFLENDLFGFLILSDMVDKDISSDARDFLTATGQIFELFLAKLEIEKRLNDIIDFMPDPTFVMNINGIVTSWNRSVEELTGWKAERILGKGNYEHAIPFYKQRRPSMSDLILHPDPEWEATYLEFRKEGDDVFVLSFCPGLPGGGAFLTGKTSRLYNADGRLWGSIHSVRDITRERQIEQNLEQSESMYRAITDFAGVGIIFFTKDKVYYYNEHFSDLLGISERQITLDDFINWIHPGDRDEVLDHLEGLFKRYREPFRFEFRAQQCEILRYYGAYVQVMAYEGQPTIHFILDDITEQKELARKARINELKLYHEDRLSALGVMAAGIAHELNQPLNTIRVVTDGFLFGRDERWALDEDELFDGLEMVSHQVVRMTEVIQNIRNFTREDRLQASWDVNANEAIENVFSMIGRQLEAHGIQVHKTLDVNLPPIKANLNRLEQVVMNLIVNARQALDECPHGHKELWVRTGVTNGAVFIEVSDNAVGIPDDLKLKIFDPFFTSKEVGKGTGLGLSITQSIVAELKGRIETFNNKKEGATFVVTIPAGGG